MCQMVADHAKFSVCNDSHGAFCTPFNQAACLAQLEMFAIAAKGFELDVLTEWTRKSYEQLSQYKPSLYPPQRGEVVSGVYLAEPISTVKVKTAGNKQ